MAKDFDVVIRGGTVMDGNGATPFVADVAVKGGRIAAIGTVGGSGALPGGLVRGAQAQA